jgi:hypothetical protein
MQEVLGARLVRYKDGRSDVQVQLRQGASYSLLHRLQEHGIRVVQFIPLPEATWGEVQEDHVLYEFPGCAIVETLKRD